MLLLRCLHDSMDVPALGAVMDGLDLPALHLPMGEPQFQLMCDIWCVISCHGNSMVMTAIMEDNSL